MEARVLSALTLAIFCLSGVHSATFTFTNKCSYTVWPGTLTRGGGAQLSSTGFELLSSASMPLDVPAPWTGQFWGRTLCSNDSTGKFTCSTADCGSGQVACNGAGAIPPASLVELTLAANFGQDFYDISLIDGFNLPVSVTPQGGNNCNATSCPTNVNVVCPSELAVYGTNGNVIACKSACLALNRPRYCCTNPFNTSAKCPATIYSMIFKKQCPMAYSYAYDDSSSTFTCTGGANYLVEFCP